MSARYFYGHDTMLDRVILPSGTIIDYEYDEDNPIGPARRFRNGALSAGLIWADPLRLAAYLDYDHMLAYSFEYDDAGMARKVYIDALAPGAAEPGRGLGRQSGQGLGPRAGQSPERAFGPDTDWAAESADWLDSAASRGKRQRLQKLLAGQPLPLELFCGCDQVGTLKLLTDKNGAPVKEVLRDSFGLQYGDSLPELFIPIGFAGGLTDPDTGLVRFGYRDYDPSVGRFTALDPAEDRRGDGDLYDYCVDDPVSRADRFGLTFTALAAPEERTGYLSGGWAGARVPLRQAYTRPLMGEAPSGGRMYAATAAPLADAVDPPAATAAPTAQEPRQQATQPHGNTNLPLGIRNNNPGNLRPLDRGQWQGQTGTENNFAIFDTPENGLRGMAVLLTTYHQVHGLRNVSSIINRYASPNDNNDTQAYINHVSQALGVAPNEDIDLRNRDVFSTLMNTMIRHETGRNPYTNRQISDAIDRAWEHRDRRR